ETIPAAPVRCIGGLCGAFWCRLLCGAALRAAARGGPEVVAATDAAACPDLLTPPSSSEECHHQAEERKRQRQQQHKPITECDHSEHSIRSPPLEPLIDEARPTVALDFRAHVRRRWLRIKRPGQRRIHRLRILMSSCFKPVRVE